MQFNNLPNSRQTIPVTKKQTPSMLRNMQIPMHSTQSNATALENKSYIHSVNLSAPLVSNTPASVKIQLYSTMNDVFYRGKASGCSTCGG